MRLHGICIVKNEGDIMRLFLEEASRWFDAVYVYDTGSTDDTWEKVLSVARTNPKVVPFAKESVAFKDSLRLHVFNHFRNRARAGDWWCRLDADEVYAEDPKRFLAEVPCHHHVVWSIHLSYYLTPSDLERFSPKDFEQPPEMTAETLPKHYVANSSEPRFFRHRDRLVWDHGAWPTHVGVVHPRRILLKHYQYRSPAQIDLRLKTRAEAKAGGHPDFDYINAKHWREALASEDKLLVDNGGSYAIDESALPRHLERPVHRFAKLAMHSLGLWP